MFTYDEIQKFNDTEIHIYKYIVSNLEKIPYMTIRELSEELHISTSTVLRFAEKIGCEGYKEFKQKVKEYLKTAQIAMPMEDLAELQHYFTGVNTSAFEEKIRTAVEKIREAEMVIFVGTGSSGELAKYGARFFSNVGKFSIGLGDALYPMNTDFPKNAVIFALSESGMWEDLVNMVSGFREKKYYIMSITNYSDCSLAMISDWNIAYNVKQIHVSGGYNATTQVPVLFVLEAIARRI